MFLSAVGRRLVFAADEYYLMARRPFPVAGSYEGFPMHEDGIGMVRTLESEFLAPTGQPTRPRAGFFAWVDGGPRRRLPRPPVGFPGRLRRRTPARRVRWLRRVWWLWSVRGVWRVWGVWCVCRARCVCRVWWLCGVWRARRVWWLRSVRGVWSV